MQSYRVSKYHILEPNIYNNRNTKQILYYHKTCGKGKEK